MSDRLKIRLSNLGRTHVIGHTLNGTDSLHYIETENPEVVIVDTHLEKGKGLDIIRKIKKVKLEVLVVAISTSNLQQYMKQSMKEGADYFFQLPEEIQNLLELLKEQNECPK